MLPLSRWGTAVAKRPTGVEYGGSGIKVVFECNLDQVTGVGTQDQWLQDLIRVNERVIGTQVLGSNINDCLGVGDKISEPAVDKPARSNLRRALAGRVTAMTLYLRTVLVLPAFVSRS